METNTERVNRIRKQLKAEFPEIKFSITKDHWLGVNINILTAPEEMGILKEYNNKHQSVNAYYIHETYTGRTKEVLQKINDIASEGVSYRETGDYGMQPDFYVHISIGRWDRNFRIL